MCLHLQAAADEQAATEARRLTEAAEAAQRHVRELQAHNEALLGQLEAAASRAEAGQAEGADAGGDGA